MNKKIFIFSIKVSCFGGFWFGKKYDRVELVFFLKMGIDILER